MRHAFCKFQGKLFGEKFGIQHIKQKWEAVSKDRPKKIIWKSKTIKLESDKLYCFIDNKMRRKQNNLGYSVFIIFEAQDTIYLKNFN